MPVNIRATMVRPSYGLTRSLSATNVRPVPAASIPPGVRGSLRPATARARGAGPARTGLEPPVARERIPGLTGKAAEVGGEEPDMRREATRAAWAETGNGLRATRRGATCCR